MYERTGSALSTLLCFCVCMVPGMARAAELTLIGPGGARAAMGELIPQFERSTGHKVTSTFGSGGRTKARVAAGEPFDVSILQPPFADVVATGHLDRGSETLLATVAVGIAVKAGTVKPDISTAEAVKTLLLSARAIAYPNADTGAGAGISFNATLAQLGIAAEMKSKTRIAQGGAGAMAMLAKGEVDLGLTYISEILPEPGVEVVGPLPRQISTPTALVAFVSASSKEAAPATALVSFLSSPEAGAVYLSRGMEPGR